MTELFWFAFGVVGTLWLRASVAAWRRNCEGEPQPGFWHVARKDGRIAAIGWSFGDVLHNLRKRGVRAEGRYHIRQEHRDAIQVEVDEMGGE